MHAYPGVQSSGPSHASSPLGHPPVEQELVAGESV